MASSNNLSILDHIQEEKKETSDSSLNGQENLTNVPQIKEEEAIDLSPNDRENEEARVKDDEKECIGETASTLNPNAQEWCPSSASVEMTPLYMDYVLDGYGFPQFAIGESMTDFPRSETEDWYTEEDEVQTEGSEQTLEVFESTLNPKAREWFPPTTSVEDRTVLMTFSTGFYPTKDQIMDYFKGIYGDVVEDVEIHRRRRGQPESGKIVFKYSCLAPVILHHRDSVKIQMAGKAIWLDKNKPL